MLQCTRMRVKVLFFKSSQEERSRIDFILNEQNTNTVRQRIIRGRVRQRRRKVLVRKATSIWVDVKTGGKPFTTGEDAQFY